jgi:hypothetical protein
MTSPADDVTLLTQSLQILILTNLTEWDNGEAEK